MIEWTKELDQKIWRMSEEGLSRAQIAKVLSVLLKCEVTKNAVVGRANRLGLPKRRKAPPQSPLRGRRYYIDKSTREKPVLVVTGRGKSGGCQYLHGDPAVRDFCGKPTVNAGSRAWCAEHYVVVYDRVVVKKIAVA